MGVTKLDRVLATSAVGKQLTSLKDLSVLRNQIKYLIADTYNRAQEIERKSKLTSNEPITLDEAMAQAIEEL